MTVTTTCYHRHTWVPVQGIEECKLSCPETRCIKAWITLLPLLMRIQLSIPWRLHWLVYSERHTHMTVNSYNSLGLQLLQLAYHELVVTAQRFHFILQGRWNIQYVHIYIIALRRTHGQSHVRDETFWMSFHSNPITSASDSLGPATAQNGKYVCIHA